MDMLIRDEVQRGQRGNQGYGSGNGDVIRSLRELGTKAPPSWFRARGAILDTDDYTGRHLGYASSPNPNSQSEHELSGKLSDKTTTNESEANQALMFCFDIAFPEKFCFVVDLVPFFRPFFVFLCFWISLHAIAWNLPQQKKWNFISFLVRLWGKTKETEARSSRSPKELLKFRLESIWENVSAIAFSSKLLSFGSMLELVSWFSDGAVEVHSLGYCTVVFASCDSVRGGRERK